MEANVYLKISDKAEIAENTFTVNLLKEISKIEDDAKTGIIKTNQSIKIKYTIKQGDYKRLNRKGVLRVYNLNQPIEIPMIKLLGKWKKSHIGVTLALTNEEWQIEGEKIENIINHQRPFITRIHGIIFKYKRLFILEKLLDKRINENNLLKNV